MLAAEVRYTASLEAQHTWSRLASLLRSWWFDDRADFAQRRWYEDLGCRVSGLQSDPLDLVAIAISGEAALEALRLVNVKSYHLLMAKIEHPLDPWFTNRGTGKAQVLGLGKCEATSLYEAGQEYVHKTLQGEPVIGAPMQVLQGRL